MRRDLAPFVNQHAFLWRICGVPAGRYDGTVRCALQTELVEQSGERQRRRGNEIAWNEDKVFGDTGSKMAEELGGTSSAFLRLIVGLEVNAEVGGGRIRVYMVVQRRLVNSWGNKEHICEGVNNDLEMIKAIIP